MSSASHTGIQATAPKELTRGPIHQGPIHQGPIHQGSLQRLFTEHPKEVNETYFEHLRAASSFAGGLAVCTFCCFVHAIVPGFFTTSASARVERMHQRMHNRGAS